MILVDYIPERRIAVTLAGNYSLMNPVESFPTKKVDEQVSRIGRSEQTICFGPHACNRTVISIFDVRRLDLSI